MCLLSPKHRRRHRRAPIKMFRMNTNGIPTYFVKTDQMIFLYFECTIYTTCLSCFVCLDSVGPSIAPTSNIHIFEDGKFKDNDYKIKFAFCSIWKLKETVIHWLSANGKFVVHRFSKIEWSYVWLVECTRCNCTHWLAFLTKFHHFEIDYLGTNYLLLE